MDGTETVIAVAAMAAGLAVAVAPEATGVMGAGVMDGAAMVSARMGRVRTAPAETVRAQTLPGRTVRVQAQAALRALIVV